MTTTLETHGSAYSCHVINRLLAAAALLSERK